MIASEPIRRRKLSHEVLDRLLTRITRGELAAGDHLPSERDLMTLYGVGRPAVREALMSLDKDRGFLKAGGVFDDDQIDAYIELKMAEVMRFEMTPHPVEFDMYYSV